MGIKFRIPSSIFNIKEGYFLKNNLEFNFENDPKAKAEYLLGLYNLGKSSLHFENEKKHRKILNITKEWNQLTNIIEKTSDYKELKTRVDKFINENSLTINISKLEGESDGDFNKRFCDVCLKNRIVEKNNKLQIETPELYPSYKNLQKNLKKEQSNLLEKISSNKETLKAISESYTSLNKEDVNRIFGQEETVESATYHNKIKTLRDKIGDLYPDQEIKFEYDCKSSINNSYQERLQALLDGYELITSKLKVVKANPKTVTETELNKYKNETNRNNFKKNIIQLTRDLKANLCDKYNLSEKYAGRLLTTALNLAAATKEREILITMTAIDSVTVTKPIPLAYPDKAEAIGDVKADKKLNAHEKAIITDLLENDELKYIPSSHRHFRGLANAWYENKIVLNNNLGTGKGEWVETTPALRTSHVAPRKHKSTKNRGIAITKHNITEAIKHEAERRSIAVDNHNFPMLLQTVIGRLPGDSTKLYSLKRAAIKELSKDAKFNTNILQTDHAINYARILPSGFKQQDTKELLNTVASKLETEEPDSLLSLACAKLENFDKNPMFKNKSFLENNLRVGGSISNIWKSALEGIIAKESGFYQSSCISGKDRRAILQIAINSLEEFYLKHGSLPEKYDDIASNNIVIGGNNLSFKEMFAREFISHHQAILLSKNIIGIKAIKHADIFIPRELKKEIKRQAPNIFTEYKQALKLRKKPKKTFRNTLEKKVYKFRIALAIFTLGASLLAEKAITKIHNKITGLNSSKNIFIIDSNMPVETNKKDTTNNSSGSYAQIIPLTSKNSQKTDKDDIIRVDTYYDGKLPNNKDNSYPSNNNTSKSNQELSSSDAYAGTTTPHVSSLH